MEKLKLNQITPDPGNPRKHFDAIALANLKNSIKTHGIKNPLIVYEQGGKYMILDGERRFRAATELGLKEVPVFITKNDDPISRLVEQFHIQEQHEGWTASEKAQVLIKLCDETNKPLKEVCGMLGISERTARVYYSFSRIMNKDFFMASNVPITLAETIGGLVKYAKKIKEDIMEENFTLPEQKKLERQLIEQVKDGKMDRLRDFTKLKDTFKASPKTIEAFISGVDADELYVKSKAKVAFHLRSLVYSASYMASNVKLFLEHPDVKPTEADIAEVRRCRKAATEFLKLCDDTE